MDQTNTAVVIGVGAMEGLGAYLCRKAAAAGSHAIVAGRTVETIERVAAAIRADGDQATAVEADATDEAAVERLFEAAEAVGPVELAIYNAGNNMPGDVLEMAADYFEACWRVGCFGGFLFARTALRQMAGRGQGSLLFTGASASMRGKPNFAAFTAAKAGLRALAQSLAREFGAKGIHVAHVVIDGGIAGAKLIDRYPERVAKIGVDALVGLDGISDAFLYLHNQPRNAWTHELDLRTHKETF